MTRTNEGGVDRLIRVAVGLAILSLLVVGPLPGWGLVGLLGMIGLVTGVTGFCPTYTLFGINTRRVGEHRDNTGGKTWSES